ncbi:YitT family protein [Paenibacillus sp. MMO-177]|uniref:YitT family protein n=1 Tax=Paenibacillus sp. MMO-177 TaxID=3081289 RepID=UPI003017ED2A
MGILSWRRWAAIIMGSLLISVGINFFLVPLMILDGGLIGIALIVNYLLHIQVGLTMLFCSIPIFALVWFQSRSMIYQSLNGLLLSSYVIDLLSPYRFHFLYYIEWTPFTRAVLGGFCIGTGLGIMLRNGTSTGGTDLLAHFLSRYIPLNVGVIIFLTDFIIIGTGAILLPEDTFLLSLITVAAGGVATSLCTWNLPHNHQFKHH